MGRSFFPTRQAEVGPWSSNLSEKLTASPTTYGVTAAMALAYKNRHDAFMAAFQTAENPDTRTRGSILIKAQTLADLAAEARMLSRLIQATPTVTDAQRADLGLTVPDAEPTPSSRPAAAPKVTIVSASGVTVRVRLEDLLNPTRRGKPEGVAGAAVFSYVGETPPAKLTQWTFEGNCSRTVVDIAFDPATAPGTRVWVAAYWFGPRLQNGPACAPVGTHLPGGQLMAA